MYLHQACSSAGACLTSGSWGLTCRRYCIPGCKAFPGFVTRVSRIPSTSASPLKQGMGPETAWQPCEPRHVNRSGQSPESSQKCEIFQACIIYTRSVLLLKAVLAPASIISIEAMIAASSCFIRRSKVAFPLGIPRLLYNQSLCAQVRTDKGTR